LGSLVFDCVPVLEEEKDEFAHVDAFVGLLVEQVVLDLAVAAHELHAALQDLRAHDRVAGSGALLVELEVEILNELGEHLCAQLPHIHEQVFKFGLTLLLLLGLEFEFVLLHDFLLVQVSPDVDY